MRPTFFTTRQFFNEEIYNVSHFETTFSQRITFSSRIVFVKSNSVAKLVSKKNCQFTPLKRQTSFFRAFLKKLTLKKIEFGKYIPKVFSKRVQSLTQFYNKVTKFESNCLHYVKFWIKLSNGVRLWIKRFKLHQLLKKNFLQINFWRMFAFKILFLPSFYNVRTENLAVLCFLHKYEFEKKNAMEKSFWIKNLTASETFNFLFFSSSIFELGFFLTCQILKQQFNNASGFQIQLIFQNQSLQQVYLSKKFQPFTSQKRQNWLFGAFMKSSVLRETEFGRQIFF